MKWVATTTSMMSQRRYENEKMVSWMLKELHK